MRDMQTTASEGAPVISNMIIPTVIEQTHRGTAGKPGNTVKRREESERAGTLMLRDKIGDRGIHHRVMHPQ